MHREGKSKNENSGKGLAGGEKLEASKQEKEEAAYKTDRRSRTKKVAAPLKGEGTTALANRPISRQLKQRGAKWRGAATHEAVTVA